MGTFTLNYNANGGGGAPASQTVTTQWASDEVGYFAMFNLSSSKPSRTYYTFVGWGKSSGSTSATWAAGGSFSTSSHLASYSTTIYAVWKHQTAYVYYNANGGSGAPSTQSHYAGYSVTLSSTTPTRTGYNFLGWATSASATTAQYQPSTTYNLFTTVTLYAVWKAAVSTLSASNGTIGSAMTLTISRNSNSYTDTITYKFGSASGTIVTKTSSASVSWTPPTSLAAQIPNASSGTCTFTISTYSGNTLLGSSTKTVTLSVPSSLAPTASVSFADTVATPLSWGVYVQSRSKLQFTISASAQESASISSYSTTVNGTTYSGASFTTDVLLYSGNNTYTTKVTDSRGLVTTVTGTFSVESYSNPSATLVSCDRDDSDPEQINIVFDFSVASVSSNNDANYSIDYKLKSASTWTQGATTALGTYSGTITDTLTGLDQGDEYDIRIRVIDSFQTSSIETEVGSTGNILLNSRHQGGLGILMKSQADDQMDVGKNTVFHGSNKEMYGSIVGSYGANGTGYTNLMTMSADLPLSDFVVDIDPVQDTSGGDPSPDNICTITGWTGANIYIGTVYGTASHTYTVDWSSDAGTIYGGTFDALTGVLTVTHVCVDMGTLSWGRTTTSVSGRYRYYSNDIKTLASATSSNNTASEILCSQYKNVTYNYLFNNNVDYLITLSSAAVVSVVDSTYSSASAFATAMNGVQLVYVLATPVEYTLTAQDIELLSGTNVIWADTGDTSMTYLTTNGVVSTVSGSVISISDGGAEVNLTAPITLEYIRTGDTSPTTLTFSFDDLFNLTSFTTNNSDGAWLVEGDSAWTLYIEKQDSAELTEVIDFHNPWSNIGMAITWNGTSVSTLPTGYVQAKKGNASIQSGYVVAEGVSSGSYHDIQVTFPVPFESAPHVLVNLFSDSAGVGMGNVTAVVLYNTITTNGFTIRCYNNDSVGRVPAYLWIAVLT